MDFNVRTKHSTLSLALAEETLGESAIAQELALEALQLVAQQERRLVDQTDHCVSEGLRVRQV